MSVTDDDALAGKKRKHEEEYFKKRDHELIEKMRRATAAQQSRQAMEEKTGLHDPELLNELEALGFTPETIRLLPLVPLLQVAWAEGGVSGPERKQILAVAHARGVTSGSPAHAQLDAWLTARPTQSTFDGATRLIRAMLAAHSAELHDLGADDLVKYCERIAAASGGVFGIGKVSTQERDALSRIAQALKKG